MWNIYEYPFTGIAVAVVVMAGLWLFWMLKPEKKRKWHLLIPLIIVVLAFAVAYFVQTDNEKIRGAINKGIKAFEELKIEPIREVIADDYSDPFHTSKEYIVAYCQAMMQSAMVDRVTFLSSETVIEGNKATFAAEMVVKFTEESEVSKMGKPFLIVKAIFHFEKTVDKRWLINNCEVLELDKKAVNWGELHS
ncbi:MAG: hypothetical protein ABR969_08320 [Sedimentisphaerales bacterium]|jgi:preprotein translocase subunit YajC